MNDDMPILAARVSIVCPMFIRPSVRLPKLLRQVSSGTPSYPKYIHMENYSHMEMIIYWSNHRCTLAHIVGNMVGPSTPLDWINGQQSITRSRGRGSSCNKLMR